MSTVLVIVPATVFLWAAIHKIGDPRTTVDWLLDLGFLWPTRGFVLLLVAADLLAAGLLIAAPRLGAALALAYLLASVPFLLRGRALGTGCGCFGKRSESYQASSWKNAALAGAILAWVIGAVLAPATWSENSWPVSLNVGIAATLVVLAGAKDVFAHD